MQKTLAVCLVLTASASLPVRALPPVSPAKAALLLARTCVKEAGWEITDDCAAIHVVLQKRADSVKRLRYESVVELYSRPSVTRPWLQQLDTSGKRPANWPPAVQWEQAHRTKWLAILEHATNIVEGQVPAVCEPDHWGDSREDRKRALRNGWTQIECGNSRNEFWRVGGAP